MTQHILPSPILWFNSGGVLPVLARNIGLILVAIALFGLFLALMGRDVLDAYGKVYNGTLGSKTGLGEIGVRMIPFVLAGLATALPARVGLINVGGEGQLHFGAWLATGVALYASGGPLFITIPFMVLAGFVGGSAWAGVAMLLRYWRGVNEVISTLLLNFVAILLVNVFVFGPWKNPDGFGYPYTANFSPVRSFRPLAAHGSTGDSYCRSLPSLSCTLCLPRHAGGTTSGPLAVTLMQHRGGVYPWADTCW